MCEKGARRRCQPIGFVDSARARSYLLIVHPTGPSGRFDRLIKVGDQDGPFARRGRLSIWICHLVDWALYLDEAGVTDPHSIPLRTGQTPIFCLAGVALPFARWRDYDRQYLYLKREFFAAEIDRSSKIDAVWEVDGSDLVAKRNANSERNRVFTYRALDLIRSLEGRIFGVSLSKGVSNPTPKTTIYTKALQISRGALRHLFAGSGFVRVLDSGLTHGTHAQRARR